MTETTRRAFLITPLSPGSAGGEDPDLYATVQTLIREAASEVQFEVIRADDIFTAGVIMDQIRNEIETSTHVVAVCTGRNPNVFYELGLAHAIGHEPVLVAASEVDLPFDVLHRRAVLYGALPDPDDFRANIRKTLEETPARATISSKQFTTPPAAPEPSPATISPRARASAARPPVAVGEMPEPYSLIAKGEVIQWDMTAKRLVQNAGERFNVLFGEHHESTPTDKSLADLRKDRFDLVTDISMWLAPAIEYRPELATKRLVDLAGWYARRPGESGFTMWLAIQETWSGLALRSMTAIALAHRSDATLTDLLGLRVPPGGARSDYEPEIPLILRSAFTWPEGYGGDAKLAHDDFTDFCESLTVSTALDHDALDLSCGVSVFLGMCRAAVDEIANPFDESSLPAFGGQRRVRAYAGFASAYCSRIGWVARYMEESEEIALRLGFESLADAREVYRKVYPVLIRNNNSFNNSCDSWESALTR